jgi:hypothetical protein
MDTAKPKAGAAAVRYCNCMEDVKARIEVIVRIVNGYSPFGDEGLDAEVVCLHLRRIMEQIAFGSLLAHQEVYESAYNDIDRIWRAKALLDRLGQIHPSFYPVPIMLGEPKIESVHNFIAIQDGFLTREDFTFLYDVASGGLHSSNPFKVDGPLIDFDRPVSEWVQRIQRLLAYHFVSFAGTDEVWIVQMDNPADHKVHAFIGQPIGQPSPALTLPPERTMIRDEPNFRLSVSYGLPRLNMTEPKDSSK